MEVKLTYRQMALILLLKSRRNLFTKKTFVPTLMDQKLWKYTNSLVENNCLWFGGRTTRKNSKDRKHIHQAELGFEKNMNLIEHMDDTHRVYKINRDNIKRYLLACLAKKYQFTELEEIIGQIEKKYKIVLKVKNGIKT